MKHRRHTYATEMVRAGGRPACAHEAARARQSRDDDALRRRCWNRFAAGVSSGPIATPAPGAATESPELLAARRSGRCNRFAAVRSTCHRDVPSLPAERRSEAPPRSTCQSAHQNPRGNTQAQTKRIAGRDWPYKATNRQMDRFRIADDPGVESLWSTRGRLWRSTAACSLKAGPDSRHELLEEIGRAHV